MLISGSGEELRASASAPAPEDVLALGRLNSTLEQEIEQLRQQLQKAGREAIATLLGQLRLHSLLLVNVGRVEPGTAHARMIDAFGAPVANELARHMIELDHLDAPEEETRRCREMLKEALYRP